ncbi:unnamed protein product [marine sediment metagenome]|uniref:Uncharacterized protein n=1 Tax=marine sediment metagenome TaxID=412755 RepID=X0RUD2_9ZZZZ
MRIEYKLECKGYGADGDGVFYLDDEPFVCSTGLEDIYGSDALSDKITLVITDEPTAGSVECSAYSRQYIEAEIDGVILGVFTTFYDALCAMNKHDPCYCWIEVHGEPIWVSDV